jgi:hypothetical protein
MAPITPPHSAPNGAHVHTRAVSLFGLCALRPIVISEYLRASHNPFLTVTTTVCRAYHRQPRSKTLRCPFRPLSLSRGG